MLVGEGHFGGDGRQPQVTLRMHVRHEALFNWIERTFPGGKLYGPYNHDGRHYFQWMARGNYLREVLVPDPRPIPDGAAGRRKRRTVRRNEGEVPPKAWARRPGDPRSRRGEEVEEGEEKRAHRPLSWRSREGGRTGQRRAPDGRRESSIGSGVNHLFRL